MNIGINGGEFIVLILIALLVLGPERLPEYTRMFTNWLRQMRDMAQGAKAQFKEETGRDFDEIEWRKYDPRQYDPRRIIREALREPAEGTRTSAGIRAEDLHGGLNRQDLQDMDPRAIFRKSSGGSTAAEAASGTGASAAATAGGAAAVAAGGAAAALMGSGRAEAAMAQDESGAPHPDTEPDPLYLLGKAPAPFDVDAT